MTDEQCDLIRKMDISYRVERDYEKLTELIKLYVETLTPERLELEKNAWLGNKTIPEMLQTYALRGIYNRICALQ